VQRLHDSGAALPLDDTGHRMVADRVVAGSIGIEDNQTEIAGTMRGDYEAPSKLQVTIVGATDFIVIMAAQAELVADSAE
jgi:hypothetical protein